MNINDILFKMYGENLASLLTFSKVITNDDVTDGSNAGLKITYG